MKVADICRIIEDFASLDKQEAYDNSGLQVGNPEAEVSGVLICLDITESVIDEAIAKACNMVLSHHPLLFRGLKQITGRTAVERVVIKALLCIRDIPMSIRFVKVSVPKCAKNWACVPWAFCRPRAKMPASV